jgi:hypothetical protein
MGMDELTIEDKKYISLKQAAQLTGYARDYVGQLCREGRVPARLIGRSWYVLETGIQDHRFGPENRELEPESNESHERSVIADTWEQPRYESASIDDVFPSLNRITDTEPLGVNDPAREIDQEQGNSWGEWFERFDKVAKTAGIASVNDSEEVRHDATSVPIHAIYEPIEADPLPQIRRQDLVSNIDDASEKQLTTDYAVHAKEKKAAKGVFAVIRAVLILAMLLAIGTTALGTGYLDQIAQMDSRASLVAGITSYNK